MNSILFLAVFSIISQSDSQSIDIIDSVAKTNVYSTFKPPLPSPVKLDEFNLRPIKADSSGIGGIDIDVYPEDAEVFVNGQKIGRGNQFLKQVQTGFYGVTVKYEDDRINEYILVHPGEIVGKEFVVQRKLKFIIEPTFSNIWVRSQRCFGPALDLGFKYKNNYYGINYTWDFGGENLECFGGAALQYYYDFNFENVVSICPGICSGFWYADGSIYKYSHNDYYYDDEDYFDESFFGGFSIKAKVGYKRIFGSISYSFLFGSYLGHILQYGLQIII